MSAPEGYPFDDLLPDPATGEVPTPDVKVKTDKRTGAEYVPKSWKPGDRPVAYGAGALIAIALAINAALRLFGVESEVSAEDVGLIVGGIFAVSTVVQAWLVQRRTQPWRDEGDDADEREDLQAALRAYEEAIRETPGS